VRAFRATNDIRLSHKKNKSPGQKSGGGTKQVNSTVVSRTAHASAQHRAALKSGVTFGRPSKPSTPIGRVLTNGFARDWIEAQQKRRSDEKRMQRNSTKKTQLVPQHTRASLGHQKVRAAPASGAAASRFKMRRFKNVPSRVAIPPTRKRRNKNNNNNNNKAMQSQQQQQQFATSTVAAVAAPPQQQLQQSLGSGPVGTATPRVDETAIPFDEVHGAGPIEAVGGAAPMAVTFQHEQQQQQPGQEMDI
jgi:hypothetical protein